MIQTEEFARCTENFQYLIDGPNQGKLEYPVIAVLEKKAQNSK